MLAKVQGAKRKRQREEEDAEMDVDGSGAEEGGEGDWMDVDEGAASAKRVKANSGAAISKGRREPASNRQLAGLRDQAVSVPRRREVLAFCPLMIGCFRSVCHSKLPRRSSYGTSAKENAICMQGRERATVLSRSRW